MQRGGEFFSPTADGIDVQAGDAGDSPVAAVAEPGALAGGVPAAVLLVETAQAQIDLLVMVPSGAGLRGEALGALALMNVL